MRLLGMLAKIATGFCISAMLEKKIHKDWQVVSSR